jgi:hypothetical protein
MVVQLLVGLAVSDCNIQYLVLQLITLVAVVVHCRMLVVEFKVLVVTEAVVTVWIRQLVKLEQPTLAVVAVVVTIPPQVERVVLV